MDATHPHHRKPTHGSFGPREADTKVQTGLPQGPRCPNLFSPPPSPLFSPMTVHFSLPRFHHARLRAQADPAVHIKAIKILTPRRDCTFVFLLHTPTCPPLRSKFTATLNYLSHPIPMPSTVGDYRVEKLRREKFCVSILLSIFPPILRKKVIILLFLK